MTHIVARTCVEITEASPVPYRSGSQPIAEFRNSEAYVLLGDPGMGKTTVFREEARLAGGHYVTARKFLRPEVSSEEKAARTLYIDELDEIRLCSKDKFGVLKEVCAKLRELGQPQVRIACRPTFWYGALDRQFLEEDCQDSKVRVLLLNPLSEADFREMLAQNHDIKNVDPLLRAMQVKGLAGLAANPLNLKLIAEMVAHGEEPNSRIELWDYTCVRLLEECNDWLDVARMDEPGAICLVQRAAYLCACLLLSGNRGYKVVGKAAPRFPRLQDLPAEDLSILRRILDSRLFMAESEGHMVPALRQTCEFLAVRHVARLLRDGLPLQRVLALVTDSGGHVMQEFAGFIAWLSECCTACRGALIQRNPADILALAETKSFSPADKLQLLNGVVDEVIERRTPLARILVGPHLGGLATANMTKHIVRTFQCKERSERQTIKVSLLIEALSRADAASRPTGPLLQVVRDTAWPLPVRLRALEAALSRNGMDESPTASELVELAAETQKRPPSEDKDAILGRLLPRLYPDTLTPTDIVQYLHTPLVVPDISYIQFWSSNILASSTETPAHLIELLDALVARVGQLRRHDRRLAKTIREVLLITLGNHLPRIAPHASSKQIAAWLWSASHALNSRTYDFGVFQSETKLRTVLQDRSTLRKELARRSNGGLALELLPSALKSLHAEDQSQSDDGWQLELLRSALKSLHEQDSPKKGIDSYRNPHGNMPGASHASDPNPPPDLLYKSALADEERFVKQTESDLTAVGQKIDSQLECNKHLPLSLNSEILFRLAKTHLGLGGEAQGLSPTMRLRNLLGGSGDFIKDVQREFCSFTRTADIPDANKILQLFQDNRLPPQTLPLLAGVHELHRSQPNHAFWSDEERLRRVVAVYLCARPQLRQGPGTTPSWFKALCESNSDVVASVFVPFVVATWASEPRFPPSGLAEILYTPAYESVARRCILPLLRKLPVRGSYDVSLMHLLQAALRLRRAEQVVEVAEKKLAAKSMTASQRVYWLTAGLFADSATFVQRLEEFVATDQYRVSLLVKAVGLFKSAGTERLSIAALAAIVRQIGKFYEPKTFASRRAPEGKSAADCVRGPLDALQSMPSGPAKEALSALASDDDLLAWRSEILAAKKRQQSLSQRIAFRYKSVQEVAQVLANAQPTSAADLAALTEETLRELAEQIRHGNTSDWRSFWNVDQHNRPDRPKPENAGRDIIASTLATMMQRQDISVHTEAVHANDARADIRVSYPGFSIPVEIKRSCHAEIWSALESQLIQKYCAAPDSDGYGIYLVLWYADAPPCRCPKRNGRAVNSASELEKLLVQTISADHKHRISVVVVDVAKPLQQH